MFVIHNENNFCSLSQGYKKALNQRSGTEWENRDLT